MQKISTIFERDWEGDRSRVLDQLSPGCEWWAAGEGTATRKMDGMCCAVIEGRLYKRREVKKGKPIPDDLIVLQTDDTTGKTIGWLPIVGGPENKYFMEAFLSIIIPDGTYELLGPKSQGGVEKDYKTHVLFRHGSIKFDDDDQPPRDFYDLEKWLSEHDIEGVVWHHPDGRMAKIKLRDFGIKRSR